MAEATVNRVRLMGSPFGWIESARRIAMVVGTLTIMASPAAAQEGSGRSELQAVLRAFYFNLAHHDWEAISADVLSAKILASRSVPPNREIPSVLASPGPCSTTANRVERAAIRLEGDWAGVSVPRCELPGGGSDRFRLVRYEKRWRFVYIDLFDPLMVVSTDR